jgi:ribosome-binding protein aMBF1 (putative translation factor)
MLDQNKQPWYVSIKHERLRRGLSQSEAAEELGIDERTLRDWEMGRHFPNYSGRRVLSSYYGKTLEELGLLDISEFRQNKA